MTFSYHMSYDELSVALENVSQENRALSDMELRCLQESLKDHLLQDLLELYPLTPQARAVVQQTVEKKVMLEVNSVVSAQESRIICNLIYGRARQKVEQFLTEHFPPDSQMPLLAKIQKITATALNAPPIQKLLIAAEQHRYQQRLRAFECCEILEVLPEQSLTEIKKDFIGFINYWFAQERTHAQSRRLRHIVAALVQRYDSLETRQQQFQAQRALIKAFDQARTTHHDNPTRYFYNHHYSSTESFIDMLLDAHEDLSPRGSLSQAKKLIQAFTAPFQQGSVGKRPTFSQSLYFYYLQAAGYLPAAKQKPRLIANPTADRVSLNALYQKTFNPTASQYAHFETLIALKSPIEAGYHDPLITFLIEQNYLVPIAPSYARPPHKTEEEILQKMEEIGPFIDRSHLLTALALSDPKASTALLRDAAEHGVPIGDCALTVTKSDMIAAYHAYRSYEMKKHGMLFEHYWPSNLPIQRDHTIYLPSGFCCSQRLCTDFLERHISTMDPQARQLFTYLSIKQGYEKPLTFLLDSQLILPNDYLGLFPWDDKLLIDVAAECGHAHIVALLIASGAVFENSRALEIAVSRGHTQIAQILLEAGCSLQGCMILGKTPLHVALQKGDNALARLLIQYSPQEIRDEALLYALEHQSDELAHFLLKSGANPHSYAHYTLGLAIFNRKEALTTLLLKAGINPNTAQQPHNMRSRCSHYHTPLGMAIAEGSIPIIQLLIQSGANMQAPDGPNCLPPLELALRLAQEGFGAADDRLEWQEVLKVLVEEGAQLQDHSQERLLRKFLPQKSFFSDVQGLFSRPEIPPRIIKRKRYGYWDSYDRDGFTELMQAVVHGNQESVRLLINNGANVNKTSPNNHSSLDLAIMFDRSMIFEICLNAQPSPYCLMKALQTARDLRRVEMALALFEKINSTELLHYYPELTSYREALVAANQERLQQEECPLMINEPPPLLYTQARHQARKPSIACWKC